MKAFVIGLTGGIGSGKSTVLEMFARLGVHTVETDALAHLAVQVGSPALAQLVKNLGKSILTKDGELNRRLLRNMIFDNAVLRQNVEAIIHPFVLQLLNHEIENAKSDYLLVSIPLLFEKNLHSLCNRVLVVDTTPELQIARTTARDKVSSQDVIKIMHTQLSRAEKLARADDILKNDGNLATLEKAVQQLHLFYLSLSQ